MSITVLAPVIYEMKYSNPVPSVDRQMKFSIVQELSKPSAGEIGLTLSVLIQVGYLVDLTWWLVLGSIVNVL